MMSKNPNKDKGTRWEQDLVKILNEQYPATWKRIPTSGAIGTHLDIPMLKGDVMGKYPFMHTSFMGEAKVGYGGKLMQINKEWFDKIQQAAFENYALPLVFLKFEKSRAGVKYVVAMDMGSWKHLMEIISDMNDEIVRLRNENTERGSS